MLKIQKVEESESAQRSIKRGWKLKKGIILPDVRNRDEYNKRHIPNSTLIPVNDLANEASKRLPDKNAEIFVY